MPTQTITVPAQQRTAPVFVPTGTLVTATPGSGATLSIEYSKGSAADIANNVATWQAWPSGAVVSPRQDAANEPMFLRATSTNGVSAFSLTDAPGVVPALVRDWASQSNLGSVSVLGHQTIAASWSDATAVESGALYSLTIPAGTLNANAALKMRMLWTVPNSAAAKRLRGRFGGNVLWNFDLTTNLSLTHEFMLVNRKSVASQICQPNTNVSLGVVSSVGNQVFTIDFAAEQTFTVTAQWPVAGAGANNITLEYCFVELIQGV